MSKNISLNQLNERIFNVRPIRNQALWDYYKLAESCFWKIEEIDFSRDKNDWDNKLNDNERHFLKYVLAFFSKSDFIVNINLDERFSKDILSFPDEFKPYTQFFYDFQKSMENIHSETYNYTLQLYITDPNELNTLTNSIITIPSIKKKAEWALKWINYDIDNDNKKNNNEDLKKHSILYRLIAFASLEGIFFSGSFCSIFWLRDKNILNGLIQSNKFISRDEGLHRDFACELYNQLITYEGYSNVDKSKILDIIVEAVEIEKIFITEALNCRLLGINANLMNEYIEFVADNLLVNIKLEKYYETLNPFAFMENISLESKTNFFERRASEYSKQGSKINIDKDNTLKILDEF